MQSSIKNLSLRAVATIFKNYHFFVALLTFGEKIWQKTTLFKIQSPVFIGLFQFIKNKFAILNAFNFEIMS